MGILADGPGGRVRAVQRCALALLLLAAGAASGAAQVALGETSRASLSTHGAEANSFSLGSAMSDNGRFVAFSSDADNLTAGDHNGTSDVYVRDRLQGTTTRISLAPDGSEGNGQSYGPSISGGGRFVAFASEADNLVPGDGNQLPDVFVHDRSTGHTERVSIGPGGVESNAESGSARISANGRHVVFHTFASNLVVGDQNLRRDVFLRDLVHGRTLRVSVASDGTEANRDSGSPAISGNGRVVTFESEATNLVPGDGNFTHDIFVHDMRTGLTQRVSVSTAGGEANSNSNTPAISRDGRYVVYDSFALNLVPGDHNNEQDVFRHDLLRGATIRVSVGTGGVEASDKSRLGAVSAHGDRIVFQCSAGNIVAGDDNLLWDAYVHDCRSGSTQSASFGVLGAPSDAASFQPSISSDGRVVAWESNATNLVPGDTNAVGDVFVRELGP